MKYKIINETTKYKKIVINTFFKLIWGSHGLMDRALDLKPEVTQGCGFESRLWQ